MQNKGKRVNKNNIPNYWIKSKQIKNMQKKEKYSKKHNIRLKNKKNKK